MVRRDDRDQREDRQLDLGESVDHLPRPYCPDAVPGGILNGSAACPDRLASSPSQEVGRVEDLAHVHHVRIKCIRRGEERLTEPAQGEVERGEHVEVVPAHRLLDAEVGERERQQQLQRGDEILRLSLSALTTEYRSFRSAAKSTLVLASTFEVTIASLLSALNASTMWSRGSC